MKYFLTQYENLGKDCSMFSSGTTELNQLLWAATGGDICTTGCAWYANGTCKGFRRLQGNFTLAYKGPEQQRAQTPMGNMVSETVKERAEREGISLSEVRRRKRLGIT